MSQEQPPEGNPRLRAIQVQGGTLSPGIMPYCQRYWISVDQSVEQVDLAIDPGDASVTVNGRAWKAEDGPISLTTPVGSSRSEIVLRDPASGESKAYTFTTRRPLTVPTWKRVAEKCAWEGRDSSGELVFQDQMWLLGGYLPKVTNDVWRSSDGVQWEQMPSIPDESGLNIPVRFVFKDQMWITTEAGGFFRSADGRSWTRLPKAPWANRRAACGIVWNNRIWVMGGAAKDRAFNDVWSSDDGINWRLETEAAAWSPRMLHDNLVVFDGMLWLIGGSIERYHPLNAYRDVWRTADGKHWERVTDEAPWAGRNWTSVVAYADRMWLLGGFSSERHFCSEPVFAHFNDVWYSADGARWKQLVTPHIWSPRHEISPYVYKGKLWVVAGNAWPLMNDVWNIELAGMTFVSRPQLEALLGVEYVYRAAADFNRGRGAVRYRLIEHPAWVRLDEATGVLRGVPRQTERGRVTMQASDAAGETATQSWPLDVIPW